MELIWTVFLLSMATSLHKYSGTSSSRSKAAVIHISPDSCDPPLSHWSESEMDAMAFKADILSSLKVDISAVIKLELKNALAEDLRYHKSKLKEVKSEIVNSITTVHSEINTMRTTIKDLVT